MFAVGAMQKRRIVADDAAAELDFAHRRALPRVFGRKPPKNRNDFFGITFWTFGHGSVMSFPSIHLCKPNIPLAALLSREGQTAWTKASGLASLRTDVPKDHIPEVLVSEEGVTYQETHLEEYVILRQEIVEFLNMVIRR